MKSIWVPVSGQIAQQQKVDTIANNIANANTTGFKKDDLIFKEYLTQLENPSDDIDIPRGEFSPDDFYRSQGAENAKVKVAGSYTDFSQGSLVPTQNPLDLALKGPGFLEISTENGIRFTRKAALSLNSQSELVTADGAHVLAAGQGDAENRKIKLDSQKPISIDGKGNIFQGENQISQLSIVEFNDVHALRKSENLNFINIDQANKKESNELTVVHQGFLESSNVNAIGEMSELIKAHRHFDTIQKAIQAYDAINVKAANDLARF